MLGDLLKRTSDSLPVTDLVPGVEHFVEGREVGDQAVLVQRFVGTFGSANYANLATGVGRLLSVEGHVADEDGVLFSERGVVEAAFDVTAVTVDGGDDTVDLTAPDHTFVDGDIIYVDGGLESFDITNIVEDSGRITLTSTGHTFINGDPVTIADVGGMTEINGSYTITNVSGDDFEILNLDGTELDGTGFSAYTSGGTVTGPANSLNGSRYTVGTVAGDDFDLNSDADAALDGSTWGTYVSGAVARRFSTIDWGVTVDTDGQAKVGITGLSLDGGSYDITIAYTR